MAAAAYYFLPLILATCLISDTTGATKFAIKEATIDGIQAAFHSNSLTSVQLIEFYIQQVKLLNPTLHGVIEINPDALRLAKVADEERRCKSKRSSRALHGIPVLVKDNVGTKDKLNTTAGSFALLGSVVRRDAGVVRKLRRAGAIVFGKASLSEWANFRSLRAPNGWSARGGQGSNPYNLSADPCGSSSGSAISVAANMVTVAIGTETDGSILCPAHANSAVGIKPTVGLTSRAGVIPISPRQDTVGPMGRTVADAVHVLDAIVGYDHNDARATREAARYIPTGGYKQFLIRSGLTGKRIGIIRNPFLQKGSVQARVLEAHFITIRQEGAILVDGLEIPNIGTILNSTASGEGLLLLTEFKSALDDYLRKELVTSPVRSLADIITFNQQNPDLEMIKEFGQEIFLASQATNGIGLHEKQALLNLERLSENGFEKLIKEHHLDAIVTPGPNIAPVLAIGGFPGLSVPAGYDIDGVPFGITFGGLKGSEAKLIEIAYGFEQATKVRKPPNFK